MSEQDRPEPQAEASIPDESVEQTLVALLGDLSELRDYLRQRGRHTYELAQRFLENARRDAGTRAYDERQAAMLEYQHYIWHEIAGLVEKLLTTYGVGDEAGEGGSESVDETGSGASAAERGQG
jgi:hypothetical protein